MAMALWIFFVLRWVRLLLVLPVMHLMKPLNVSKVGRCLVLQWVIYSSSKPNLGTCHLILMQVHFSFIVLPGPKTIVQTGLHVKLPWQNYLQQKRHQRVIDEAVQIFGGSGVVSGFAVELLYRKIRALRIYEGASEVQKLIIASQTLKDNQCMFYFK